MFHIGDKIFYPVHGAGVIESIVEKEFLGEKQSYYVLDMLLRELQIMVPLNKINDLHIRLVVEERTLEAVFVKLHEGEPDMSVTAAQRHRINMEKLKSGDIYEGAEVIRDLSWISRTKNLGTGDKLMLDQAQQLFISEVELVKGVDTEEASDLLKQAIHR
ncbi:CarD family transcriptional regulator [Brevibacillus ruminantium]|uniref:CarD family transcriptional regulator n=1 Tax=Brevibacillus ruminantium TaxID=2950604 RepID=A0ABY4WEL1_9BACL|nr:CarD family transcriptional regulator [Brevibacillus ruminantium]USG65592.1 CarD family transcriptional regulator [Brevibacillus ruminantium]